MRSTTISAQPPGALSEQDRRQLISELFHALSQPLTALRCSLEMALGGRFSPGPSEESLRLALAHSEQIAHLATGIRELLEAEAPGTPTIVVNLESSLGEAVMDLAPVAEASGIKLFFNSQNACPVMAEPRRLRQALFYLLESALSSAAPGDCVQVETGERERQAVVLVSITRSPVTSSHRSVMAWPGTAKEQSAGEEKERELGRRLGLAIASRTFEAAGGRLYGEQDHEFLRLRLLLPLAPKAS